MIDSGPLRIIWAYFYYTSTVESVIEVGLVFNFWILGADFYSSFYQFLLNKCPHFHEFLRLLFESVFFSSQTTITDCTVLCSKLFYFFVFHFINVWATLSISTQNQRQNFIPNKNIHIPRSKSLVSNFTILQQL